MAPAVFKTVSGALASWVGSIPMHSRQRGSVEVDAATRAEVNGIPTSLRTICWFLALAVAAHGVSAAQRPDSSVVRPAPTGPVAARAGTAAAAPLPADTARPPITPRRAFLYAVLVPGSAQSILGQNKTAALLLAFEGVAIAMIRESAADVHEARRIGSDSLVLDWATATQKGATAPGPLTPRSTGGDFVRSRRSHLEDWIFILIANHLFSGADAFVAANLWDLPAELSARTLPDGRVGVGASLSF